MTVREVADQIVELGLVDAAVLDPMDLDYTLDDFGATESQAVLVLLDYMKVRYSTEYKTFRHACEDDAWVYREELERIAACGRGLFTITEVELVDTAEGDHLLRFRCNGRPHEWPIAHGPDEEFDAQSIFCWSVGELVPPGSPARWCTVDPGDPDVTSEAFFGDPAALNVLGGPFGLQFEPIRTTPGLDPSEPVTADVEHLQSWLRTRQAGFPNWTARYGDGITWDHSSESLEALGAIVLRRTPTLDALADPANADFVEGASWYTGEALRRVKGGRWFYRDGDPEVNLFDGYPFVEQNGPHANTAVPYRALRVLIKRGDPQHLRKRYNDFSA
ncbi:hypothetical protein [Nocardia sp. NPDC057440]|uniref:hypothetical protein n=1 Tax=Nocardia sp. NPDC057440 TaxID=3346134 RepID=UPI00366AD437